MTEPAWFYAKNGTQVGPLSLSEITTLINNQDIVADTKVWNGTGDWSPASNQPQLEAFFQIAKLTPPPLTGRDIDNRFIWALVSVPIVGALLENMFNATLIWLYIVLNITFCVLDERKLKSAGHNAPMKWMLFIVPAYLWKRAEILHHKKVYVWCWIVAFSISIFISIAGEESTIETAACPVVSDILQKHLTNPASCKAVTITEEVTSGFYRAYATLDNGNDLDITIEKRNSGQIYVRIPNL
ncbi:TPA: DUF4339 domain-containing protein [Aeromonas veronii]|nr:DUF4339 domain-containing protein [Aeromonas veronii]